MAVVRITQLQPFDQVLVTFDDAIWVRGIHPLTTLEYLLFGQVVFAYGCLVELVKDLRSRDALPNIALVSYNTMKLMAYSSPSSSSI